MSTHCSGIHRDTHTFYLFVQTLHIFHHIFMFTYNIIAENDFLYMAYFDFFVLIHSETFFLTLCFSVIITSVRTDIVELICAILLVTILSCVFLPLFFFFVFHMFLSLVILIDYFMSFLKTFFSACQLHRYTQSY